MGPVGQKRSGKAGKGLERSRICWKGQVWDGRKRLGVVGNGLERLGKVEKGQIWSFLIFHVYALKIC